MVTTALLIHGIATGHEPLDAYFAQLFRTICAAPFGALVFYTGNWLWAVMSVPLWIMIFVLYEPFCLSKWGTTLGKLLWHIEVRHPDGTTLTVEKLLNAR